MAIPDTSNGKVTKKLRDRVMGLRAQRNAQGNALSYRAIAAILETEGTPLSHVAVQNVIREGERRKARIPAKPRTAPSPPTATATTPPATEPEPPDSALPPLPDDASLAAKACYRDLLDVTNLARDIRGDVISGDERANQYSVLIRTAASLRKELADLLPPPIKDPSKDPVNIAAREMIHAHVLRAIEGAEARLGNICPRCRKEIQSLEGTEPP
jgi:hypothetical protein